MPGVTEEQITAAKQMSAIEFLRRYRPGQLVKAESLSLIHILRGHFLFYPKGELHEKTSKKISVHDDGGASLLWYCTKQRFCR